MKNALYSWGEKEIRKVKVINSFYTIISVKKMLYNKEDYTGFIDYDRHLIFLKHKKDKLTLNHELTHAFFNELYLTTKFKFIKKIRSNEFFIDLVSRFITLF